MEKFRRWGAKTRIVEGPNSKNLIAHYSYNDSWLGYYRPSPFVAGQVTQFSISKRDFCAEHNIIPTIEVISADQIDEAYERVLASNVKYRFVIDISTM